MRGRYSRSVEDLVSFLTACLDEDELTAKEGRCINCGNRTKVLQDDCSVHVNYTHDRYDPASKRFDGWDGVRCPGRLTGAERYRRPEYVLLDVAAKRAILAEVASWRHDYVDGDSWLSCGLAVDPHDEEGVPGSGCADEGRRGGSCGCGLERRREAILRPLTMPYEGRPGYKDGWRS